MIGTLVLSVDPGGTNGWATWSHGKVQMSGQSGFDTFVGLVDDWSPSLAEIVCERYTITAETLRKSRQTTALEVIGFLRYVGVREGIPFTLQKPADAKKFATDARLTAAGWRMASAFDHANDALRHLMLYLVKSDRMAVPR